MPCALLHPSLGQKEIAVREIYSAQVFSSEEVFKGVIVGLNRTRRLLGNAFYSPPGNLSPPEVAVNITTIFKHAVKAFTN